MADVNNKNVEKYFDTDLTICSDQKRKHFLYLLCYFYGLNYSRNILVLFINILWEAYCLILFSLLFSTFPHNQNYFLCCSVAESLHLPWISCALRHSNGIFGFLRKKTNFFIFMFSPSDFQKNWKNTSRCFHPLVTFFLQFLDCWITEWGASAWLNLLLDNCLSDQGSPELRSLCVSLNPICLLTQEFQPGPPIHVLFFVFSVFFFNS